MTAGPWRDDRRVVQNASDSNGSPRVAWAITIRYHGSMSLAEIKELATQLPPEDLSALTSFLVRLTQNSKGDAFNGAVLSESVLSREWNSPEEDAAWENL